MILVTGPKDSALLLQITDRYGLRDVRLVHKLEDLGDTSGECLICFNTGIIIPAEALEKARGAYNFHAASPEFPGRDPHHWAVHRGAKLFGATCHIMVPKVDDGPIVEVSTFPITGLNPEEVAAKALDRAAQQFDALLPRLLNGDLSPMNVEWGPSKSTRKQSIAMRGQKGFEDF